MTDVHITFNGPIEELPRSVPPFTSISSNGNVLDLDGGNVAPGNTFDLPSTKIGGQGPALITKIEWTQAGVIKDTLSKDTDEKRWKKYGVPGFTGEELFDFSNLNDVRFIMIGQAELRYTLFDLAIYTGLPLSNFDVDNFKNTSAGTLAFSSPQFVIEPGTVANISLGPMQAGYALAGIGTLMIEDTANGDVLRFTVPQFYGESAIPEPSTVTLLGTGGLGLLLIGRRLKMAKHARMVE